MQYVCGVRILTYNVRYFSHATRGLATTARAMRSIADVLARMNPPIDVMCLQEIEATSFRSSVAHRPERVGETQLEQFVRALHQSLEACGSKDTYEAYYFPAHTYRVTAKTNVYTTGLSVLTRRPILIDHHNAQNPVDITHRHLHPIKGLKQTRICAHMRVRDPNGQTIDLFNTHLSLPSAMTREFWSGEKRLGWGRNQLAEAVNLARFVKQERTSDAFFVVGDFNALPDSPTYDYLTTEAGFTDVLSAKLAPWPTAGFMSLRMRLDHMFSGRGLRWSELEQSKPFGDRASPFHLLSDHVPLVGRCQTF